ncbi:MAG: pantoate--beta-alanine ligase, partial [Calditrichia bacterium]
NMDVHLETGPIVREPDGLALSSRNKYLSDSQRKKATVLYHSLQMARNSVQDGIYSPAIIRMQMEQFIRSVPEAVIDYIAIVHPYSLDPLTEMGDEVLIALAVYIGEVRLIDNIVIKRN